MMLHRALVSLAVCFGVVIPIAGLELPGPLTLEITYTPPNAAGAEKPETLHLDAWTLQ